VRVAPDFHWSELQRSPGAVENAINEYRKVKIIRRGKSPLVLSAIDAADTGLQEATTVLAHVLGETAVLDGIAQRAAAIWPWLPLFDDDDRRTFSIDLATTLRACASLGEFGPLELLLTRWRNTASALALGVDLKTPVAGDNVKTAPRSRS
jgi:hypothetical protein